MARLKSNQARTAGSALVEFALVSPVLLLLLAGVLDYGRALRHATAVANAARVGAQYSSRTPANSMDTAGIRAAAVSSAPDLGGLTVTSTRSCQCSGGSAVSCTGSCGGSKMQIYVQVSVTGNVAAIFNYSGLPYPGNVAARATMRVQ